MCLPNLFQIYSLHGHRGVTLVSQTQQTVPLPAPFPVSGLSFLHRWPLGPPLLPWEIIASRNLPGTQSLADVAQRLLTTADTKTLPLRASKLWALLLSPSKSVLPEQN